MKTRIPFLAMLCAAIFMTTHAQAPAALSIRFIGNEAVAITDGRITLVSDFPYQSGYSGYMKYDWPAAKPPGEVIALVTHKHRDHFAEELFRQTNWRIVAPPEITQRLPKERVIGMARPVEVSGIRITPIPTTHADIEHYSYLVEWAGRRFYFVGDTESPDALLAQRGLDIAFVSPWLYRAAQARGKIDASRIAIYHHTAGEDVPRCDRCVTPAQNAAIELPPRRASNMFPQWSHDGARIVFTSTRDADPEIYVMNADGSRPQRLTTSPGRDAHPSFARDGRIVFQSPRINGTDVHIFVMNADGSGVKQLTRAQGFAGVPVYSPDQNQIAFQWDATWFTTKTTKWRIGIMNADGSGLRMITDGRHNDQVPNWSSDGKRLIFFSDRSGKNQIYTMRADGTDIRRVAETSSDDLSGAWSPDNHRIAFTSDRDGNREIYVMDAGGANQRRLTSTPADEWAPVWSPDGRRIAFVSERDGQGEIYVMNADGSNQVRLTGKL